MSYCWPGARRKKNTFYCRAGKRIPKNTDVRDEGIFKRELIDVHCTVYLKRRKMRYQCKYWTDTYVNELVPVTLVRSEQLRRIHKYFCLFPDQIFGFTDEQIDNVSGSFLYAIGIFTHLIEAEIGAVKRIFSTGIGFTLKELPHSPHQGCGSAFIFCGSGSSSISECGSGSRFGSSLTKFVKKISSWCVSYSYQKRDCSKVRKNGALCKFTFKNWINS